MRRQDPYPVLQLADRDRTRRTRTRRDLTEETRLGEELIEGKKQEIEHLHQMHGG